MPDFIASCKHFPAYFSRDLLNASNSLSSQLKSAASKSSIHHLFVIKLYPCSTKTRDGLGNPSPTPKISRDPRDFPREISRVEGNLERFPAAMGFAPRDPRDFPRAKPEGNPEGRGVQNPWPREISRAEGMDFPIPPESWWSTDILSSLPGKAFSSLI